MTLTPPAYFRLPEVEQVARWGQVDLVQWEDPACSKIRCCPAKVLPVAEIYTNAEPALLSDRKSFAGKYVIAEFAHDPDLSARSADGDKVSLTQDKSVRTTDGTVYAASATVWDNTAGRGNDVVIRSIKGWEQSHWWWDDSRSAMLEYSI